MTLSTCVCPSPQPRSLTTLPTCLSILPNKVTNDIACVCPSLQPRSLTTLPTCLSVLPNKVTNDIAYLCLSISPTKVTNNIACLCPSISLTKVTNNTAHLCLPISPNKITNDIAYLCLPISPTNVTKQHCPPASAHLPTRSLMTLPTCVCPSSQPRSLSNTAHLRLPISQQGHWHRLPVFAHLPNQGH